MQSYPVTPLLPTFMSVASEVFGALTCSAPFNVLQYEKSPSAASEAPPCFQVHSDLPSQAAVPSVAGDGGVAAYMLKVRWEHGTRSVGKVVDAYKLPTPLIPRGQDPA